MLESICDSSLCSRSVSVRKNGNDRLCGIKTKEIIYAKMSDAYKWQRQTERTARLGLPIKRTWNTNREWTQHQTHNYISSGFASPVCRLLGSGGAERTMLFEQQQQIHKRIELANETRSKRVRAGERWRGSCQAVACTALLAPRHSEAIIHQHQPARHGFFRQSDAFWADTVNRQEP